MSSAIFCPSSRAAAILKCTRLFTREPVSTTINCQSVDVSGTAEMLQCVPQFLWAPASTSIGSLTVGTSSGDVAMRATAQQFTRPPFSSSIDCPSARTCRTWQPLACASQLMRKMRDVANANRSGWHLKIQTYCERQEGVKARHTMLTWLWQRRRQLPHGVDTVECSRARACNASCARATKTLRQLPKISCFRASLSESSAMSFASFSTLLCRNRNTASRRV